MVPGPSRRPGLTNARHTPGDSLSSNSSSTLPPVPARRPTSRAGITLLSLNTSTSPADSRRGNSEKRVCSAGAPSSGATINRDESRRSSGVCAISSGGRS